MRLSLSGGVLLAAPVLLWQLWGFLAPALDGAAAAPHRRLRLLPGLLAAGILFGYFVALPAAVHYLTNYDKRQFHIQLRAKD